ncbi:hypothetical protein LCGC14_0521420 [marine sediment metagenome]|uniref:CMP/dCMP-type deaminase domain-containing protein n=1 Tax=marine sediment metagenome TaxID=412755 RepID=A0A0F9SGT9_9ZZZZ
MNFNEYEIMHLLNKLKEKSNCLDKQVACIITDSLCNILSVGINRVLNCDKDCYNKEKRICVTTHAEIEACNHLTSLDHGFAKTAYLNLFPCVPCQRILKNWVKEIVVFGPKHKEQEFKNIRLERNLYFDLLDKNKQAKQLSVAQGELCELVTAISDYFYRPEKNMNEHDFVDEIIDAELMLDQIKLICWQQNTNFYNILRDIRNKKYMRIQLRLNNGGIQ